jgi:hypothetical protein
MTDDDDECDAAGKSSRVAAAKERGVAELISQSEEWGESGFRDGKGKGTSRGTGTGKNDWDSSNSSYSTVMSITYLDDDDDAYFSSYSAEFGVVEDDGKVNEIPKQT